MSKNQARLRRAKKSRVAMKNRGDVRLVVTKSSNHIYAQVISSVDAKVIASASTLSSELKGDINHGGNIDAAKKVGALIAQRALACDVDTVAFDRSGYKYHGRIKSLAESAREAGLKF